MTEAEELPVRLAHRIKELESLPHGLAEAPSIAKVKNWYAQSFDEIIRLPPVKSLPPEITEAFSRQKNGQPLLPSSTPNPSLHMPGDDPSSGNLAPPDANRYDKSKMRMPIERRYYANPSLNLMDWPADIIDFNARFTRCLSLIKQRHDPTVTTVAQGVLEWKRSRNAKHIGLDVQTWLDR
jgi:pyruvate dehydrogenase kinase 2/3/4